MPQATTFKELQLSDFLLEALTKMNFEVPSPVQAQTIPYLLEGRDVIGQAQTGTGKTAAFALPIIEKIDTSSNATQAIIVAPTRELAMQIAEHFEALSVNKPGIRTLIICGGQNYRPQLDQLKAGAHIVVGTPGRILDHLERKTLQLGNIKTLVLDEADEMLRMGFIDDIEKILAKLPEKRQIALFSATMPPRIKQVANRYIKDAITVEIKSETATVKSIEQRYLFAPQHQKVDALLRLLAVEEYQGLIIFVRTKTSTEEVAESLQKQGHKAMAIHGDITQVLRERVISQFRDGRIDILVATDVAARGLDVERVTHVINYDVPHDCETYVHRIGRTGRAGRSGTTILFITPRESRILSTLERHTRQLIEKMSVPDNDMIQAAKQKQFIKDVLARLESSNLASYQALITDFIANHPEVSPTDIAAALALMVNLDKPWQVKLPKFESFSRTADVNPRDARRGNASGSGAGPRFGKEGRSSSSRDGRPSFSANKDNRSSREDRFSKEDRSSTEGRFSSDDSTQELYRLDVGRIHGVKPGNIVGAIANEAGLQSRFITGLKINDDHSMVKLPKSMPKETFNLLTKAWVCGRQLNVKKA